MDYKTMAMSTGVDILDHEESDDGYRWVMYYSDGEVRRSPYRYDLIRYMDQRTEITGAARFCWWQERCPYEVVEEGR